jgi:glucokinase
MNMKLDEGPVLVADVGGTHCRFALAFSDAAHPRFEHLRVVPTPQGRFEDAARAYLDQVGCAAPRAIAVAAAGRVHRTTQGARVRLTNVDLDIDQAPLARMAEGRAWVLNDLGAVAAALPLLRAEDAMAFGPERPAARGLRLVVGVGTGFGAAARGEGGELIDTESGHADLAAVSAQECRLYETLARTGRVSVEQVLSGPGLLRLHEAVSARACPGVDVLLDAWHAGDADARRTLEVFSTWLGRVVGNLVLSLGAWGGVSLIGGVTAGLGPALDAAAFRRGFEDKAPFVEDLSKVPVQRVLHTQPALLGLAGLALTR